MASGCGSEFPWGHSQLNWLAEAEKERERAGSQGEWEWTRETGRQPPEPLIQPPPSHFDLSLRASWSKHMANCLDQVKMLICVSLSVPSNASECFYSDTEEAKLVSPNQIPGGADGPTQRLAASIHHRPSQDGARFDPTHISWPFNPEGTSQLKQTR